MNQPEVPERSTEPAHQETAGRPPWEAWEPHDTRPSRIGRTVLALILAIAGLAVAVAGVTSALLPRHFTAGQAQQIMAWETSKRWRSWPAGQIFPATVGYQLPADSLSASSGLRLTASRAGIGPQASCSAAADRAAGRQLSRYGCAALLRATYTDASGAFVTTVGIAVMGSPRASLAARDALLPPGSSPRSSRAPSGQGPGVRALPVAGSLAATFGDAQRQMASVLAAGPYLVMYTTGYTDGRPRSQIQPDQYAEGEMVSVSVGVAGGIASRIGAPPQAPHCPGAPGC